MHTATLPRPEPYLDRSPVYTPQPRPIQHPLSDKDIATYREKGYLVLRSVFHPDEVFAWHQAAEEIVRIPGLIHEDNLRLSLWKDPHSGRQHVWKIDQFVDLSIVFGELARDPRILDPLAMLFGGSEPRLFKDKLIYKPPGSQGNGLHQDYNWWQGFPTSLISVIVALDPATRENGCTEVFPGHQRGLMTEAGAFGHLKDEMIDIAIGEKIETQPGDIAFFHCFTPHRAGSNQSSSWRRQAFLTYNSAVDGEHYQAHREHYNGYVRKSLDEATRARKFFR